MEIHGLCDSSFPANCNLVYIRMACFHGVIVNLLTGKCIAALLKELTIPGLELMACILLSEFVVAIMETEGKKFKIKNVVFLVR